MKKKETSKSISRSEELVDKIWAALVKNQQLINQQLEEYEIKYNQNVEKNNRLIEESEKKVFREIDEKNRKSKEDIIDPDYNKKTINPDIESEKKEEPGKPDKRLKNKIKTLKARTYDNPEKKENPKSSSDFFKLCNEKGWVIHGAITGSQFTSEEKKAILEAGFFLIEKYNNSYILDVTDNFVPREL